jgi:hypothetical protein
MKRRLNINRKNKLQAIVGIFLTVISQPAPADRNGDEDETQYEFVVQPSFERFHKRNHRFPRNWTELNIQNSCGGYSTDERKHFPKANESILWTPSECELSYKLVFSEKNRFRVVALAKGHVVSVYENYRATYYKTPYHNHNPSSSDNGQD